jgi:hypothetical protein
MDQRGDRGQTREGNPQLFMLFPAAVATIIAQQQFQIAQTKVL